MATQAENPITPGHFACLKGLLACIQVNLNTENVGAGRSAEDNGTNHKRKAEGLSIMFLPQKFLWGWAKFLQIPPEGNVLSLIPGCSAQAPSYWERCGSSKDRLWWELKPWWAGSELVPKSETSSRSLRSRHQKPSSGNLTHPGKSETYFLIAGAAEQNEMQHLGKKLVHALAASWTVFLFHNQTQ